MKKHALTIALVATFLICRESPAVIFSGYVYDDCPSRNWYSFSTGKWYYMAPTYTVVLYDYCDLQVYQLDRTPADPCDDSVWIYFSWPYLYFYDTECWNYIYSATIWLYDYSSGTWSLLGQP